MDRYCIALAAAVVCLALLIYIVSRNTSGGNGQGVSSRQMGATIPVLRDGAAGVPCPDGKICINGVCGACVNGPDPSTACPAGLVCSGGKCNMCSASMPCPTGVQCIGGLCTGCGPNVPCPAGQVCSGGKCGPCSDSAPCPDGYVCSGGSCVPKCVPCDNDLHSCGAGQICAVGTCVPAPACSATNPCPAGLTCGTDGKCASCYTWKTWMNPGAVMPTDIYGAGTFAGVVGPVAPVIDPNGGLNSFGFIDTRGAFNGINDGALHPSTPTQVKYLSTANTCPPLKVPTVTAGMVKYGPTPICMDLAKKGVLTGMYANCEVYPSYNFQNVGTM